MAASTPQLWRSANPPATGTRPEKEPRTSPPPQTLCGNNKRAEQVKQQRKNVILLQSLIFKTAAQLFHNVKLNSRSDGARHA